MSNKKYQTVVYPLLAALLCIAISWPMLGKYYFQPNKYIGAFGGDAFVILYDLAYHILYGNENMLTNNNYPFGELIYVSGTQGAVAQAASWFHRYIFPIGEYAAGISNALNVWSLPLTSIFIYYLLTAWQVSRWSAIVFAALITVLSPQMMRMVIHYGLAYPFVIPMAMLWTLRKYRLKKFEWRDLLVFTILLFFTFNNPYIGISASFIILASSFVYWWKEKKYSFEIVLTSLMAISLIGILFIYLKLQDPFHDRVEIQWGYFTYKSTLEGYIAPPNSLLDLFFKREFGKGFQVQLEAIQNVGIVVVLTYLSWLIFSILRKRKFLNLTWQSDFKYFFWGSVLVLIYATAILFMIGDRDWIEEKLGFMLMFKALGRISWSFYYVASIGGVILLDKMMHLFKNKYLHYGCLIIFSLIWWYEIHIYMAPGFKNIYNDNQVSVKQLEKTSKFLSENKIKAEEYQAILLLPKCIFWSDKFRTVNMEWLSQFHGTQASLVTGLPMINTYLSRSSVGNTSEALEMYSHPLIEKSLPSKFKSDKDILIIAGVSQAFQEGEQHLMSIADTLAKVGELYYLRLPIERINEYQISNRNKWAKQDTTIVNDDRTVLLSYEDTPNNNHYFGIGATNVSKGVSTMYEYVELNDSVNYEFSAWVHIDKKKYGMGKFILDVNNTDNSDAFETHIETGESPDIQDDWMRASAIVNVKKGQKLYVKFEGNQVFTVDEILLRPVESDHLVNSGDPSFVLFNGFRLKR